MTFTEAAFYGMGLVLLFGLAALGLSYWSGIKDKDEHTHSPVH